MSSRRRARLIPIAGLGLAGILAALQAGHGVPQQDVREAKAEVAPTPGPPGDRHS